MHPHLIDWFRGPHLVPNESAVSKRWSAANALAESAKRDLLIDLLRLFLFEAPKQALIDRVTPQILKHDPTFPVADNTEELRLMAGVVGVAAFAEATAWADAFALGLQAAHWRPGRTIPAQVEIIRDAAAYLESEGDRVRPTDFGALPKTEADKLPAALKALVTAEGGDDKAAVVAPASAYRSLLVAAMNEADVALARQVQRLSEESALLWWIIAEHSMTLRKSTNGMPATAYALIAATEAAERTRLLPPPASAGPLLARALKPTKAPAKGEATVAQYLSATDPEWRSRRVENLRMSDCQDLVPFATGLAKTEEFGSAQKAVDVLPNLCPGVASNQAFTPAAAAHQHYVELMFLRALEAI